MRSTIRILLVEDNPDDALLIEKMLKKTNVRFELKCVELLSSAREQIQADGFDIILLDLGLPDSLGGVATITKLNEVRPEAPIIVLTGFADEDTGIQAVKEGAQDYLIKGQVESNLLIRSINYAIERKKAKDALMLNEDRLETLLKLTQMITETDQDLIAFALEEAVRLTRSEGGYLHFFDENEQTIQLYSWSKNVLKTCKAAKDEHYPLDAAGVWADSVRIRRAVIHNDYQNLPSKKGYPAGHFHLIRHLGVPITDGDRIVGATGVGNKEELYNEADVRQLTLLMNSMWRILKQKRMDTELKLLAITDGLTGLANRRHFNSMLNLEIKRASRDKDKALSLLMCDVDFFKRYNDHYGHIAGDICLQKIADILRRVFKRVIDLPARYGGEEFAVIIPDTPREQVRRLANTLREAIMAEAIPHPYSDVARVVTLSIGFVSAKVTEEMSVDWFIQQADNALYRSKAQGRNLVNAAEQEG
jgi:diguanylate cyclase (GGDEF)-like protein